MFLADLSLGRLGFQHLAGCVLEGIHTAFRVFCIDQLSVVGELGELLVDLAKEIGGIKPPNGLYGRSLMPLLKSGKSGQIDPTRNWVITGRERHVGTAREGNLPYPMRALRTPEFVYIRNFAPDRWPMGSPKGVTATETPPFNSLQDETYAAFADMDSSPTKAWLVTHRNEPEWKWHYEFAFGKRPAEELYDVRTDPDQVKNLASDPAYAKQKAELSNRLMKLLTEANDPRVVEQPPRFEQPPFVEQVDRTKAKGGGKKKQTQETSKPVN